MKLYYYRDRQGNFGDDLNPWLWPKLLPPGTLDDDPTSLLLGIGTILGRAVPASPIKWVIGSGTGYSQVPPLDDNWRFMCVRGPMTAHALGLSPELAATDPAALLHRQPGLTGQRRTGAAFMPHHVSVAHFDWKSLCDRVGLAFVDPRASVDSTLATLATSALVITESLHGAIVADTLRVPWIPVVCYDHILAFKWLDWAASLGLEYAPRTLPALTDRERELSPSTKSRNALKRALRSVGIGRERFSSVPRAASSVAEVDATARELETLARSSGLLSTERALTTALGRLDAAIDRFISLTAVTSAVRDLPRG